MQSSPREVATQKQMDKTAAVMSYGGAVAAPILGYRVKQPSAGWVVGAGLLAHGALRSDNARKLEKANPRDPGKVTMRARKRVQYQEAQRKATSTHTGHDPSEHFHNSVFHHRAGEWPS